MTKHYIIAAIIVCIITIYLFGRHIGVTKCNQELVAATIQQTEIHNQKKEKINAEVYHTGVRDIRRVLREKYTIAD